MDGQTIRTVEIRPAWWSFVESTFVGVSESSKCECSKYCCIFAECTCSIVWSILGWRITHTMCYHLTPFRSWFTRCSSIYQSRLFQQLIRQVSFKRTICVYHYWFDSSSFVLFAAILLRFPSPFFTYFYGKSCMSLFFIAPLICRPSNFHHKFIVAVEDLQFLLRSDIDQW